MINRALRLLRTYYRFTQVELAKKLGISNSYLSEIESGSKSPSFELLERYSEVFKIPASTIMLFAEKINGERTQGEQLRVAAADKILRVLEWIEDSDEIKKSA